MVERRLSQGSRGQRRQYSQVRALRRAGHAVTVCALAGPQKDGDLRELGRWSSPLLSGAGILLAWQQCQGWRKSMSRRMGLSQGNGGGRNLSEQPALELFASLNSELDTWLCDDGCLLPPCRWSRPYGDVLGTPISQASVISALDGTPFGAYEALGSAESELWISGLRQLPGLNKASSDSAANAQVFSLDTASSPQLTWLDEHQMESET